MTGEVQGDGFKDPRNLTMWVKYFIYAQIIISIVGLISGYMEYSLLNDYLNGVYTSQEQAVADGEANDSRQLIVGLFQMLIFIVSGIFILMWIYRANYNARQLGAKEMEYTPGWSVGWFFIPIALLWKPYQAMKEIWRASHQPEDWKECTVPSLLPWWWFFWLVSSFIGNAAFRISLRADTLNELLTASKVLLASDLSSIPLALVTLKLVMSIHAAHMSKVKLEPEPASDVMS